MYIPHFAHFSQITMELCLTFEIFLNEVYQGTNMCTLLIGIACELFWMYDAWLSELHVKEL